MSGENFIQRIIASLFHTNDADAEKRRLLKNISKELGKQKYKFYKHSSHQVLPGYAQQLYDIYKLIAPIQAMFQGIKNPNTFKNWIMSSSLTEDQHNLYEQLSEENIIAQSKQKDLTEVINETRKLLSMLTGSFHQEDIDQIDTLYTTLMTFQSFCNFDYYFTLKKFCSGMREQDFNSTPKFEAIDAEYVIDDVKDFCALYKTIPLDQQLWQKVFALIKEHKGFDPVPMAQWNKLLNRFRDLTVNNTLDMMIQLITENPSYATSSRDHMEHITEAFVEKLRTDTDTVLRKLQNEQNTNKSNNLLTQIFGTTDINRMKYYTEAGNEMFAKRGMSGYTLYKPMNYLKAFLLDYVKKDVRDFCELVLVRGKWIATTQASAMSDAYNMIIGISDNVTAFDEQLVDGGDLNTRLKSYTMRADRDVEARKLSQSVLRDINEQARDIIIKATQQLVIIGRFTKALLEDREKPSAELLMNWKELEHFSDGSVKDQGLALYKKMYMFVQLMQMYMKSSSAN